MINHGCIVAPPSDIRYQVASLKDRSGSFSPGSAFVGHDGSMNEHTTPNPAPDPPSTQPLEPGGRRRTILLGAAVAAAVLVVGGAGAAITLSVTGDDEPANVSSRVDDDPRAADDDHAGDHHADTDRDRPDDSPAPGSTPDVPADAAALTRAIDAAVAVVPGALGASAIDVERTGWDVDVVRSGGGEVEVFVSRDGTAGIRDDDEDDDDADPVLDTSRIGAVVDAALAAAGPGRIDSLATDDDDDDHFYEVNVDLDDGRDAEVELTRDLAVVSVERDD